MLSQVYLKKLLFFNPKTGIFTWRVSQGSIRMGVVAGYVHNRWGYRIIRVNNKKYRAARLAFLYMTGKFPEEEADHHDRVKDNDAWDNLRDVSHSINQRNRLIQSNNTSGVTGVRQIGRKWRVRIRVDGKIINLGSFKNKLEAIQTRQEAEKRYGYVV